MEEASWQRQYREGSIAKALVLLAEASGLVAKQVYLRLKPRHLTTILGVIHAYFDRQDDGLMPRCSQCGMVVRTGARFCTGCGAAISLQETLGYRCPHCGGMNDSPRTFCVHCGSALQAGALPANSPASVSTRSSSSGENLRRHFSMARLVLKSPLALLMFVFSFGTHYYLMAFVNDGIYPDKIYTSGERSGQFTQGTMLRIPQTNSTPYEKKQEYAKIETQVYEWTKPIVPYLGYFVNWKDRAKYNYNFSQNPNQEMANRPEPSERIWAAFFNGNFASSFTMWTCGSVLSWTLIWSILTRGPFRGIANYVSRPFQLLGWFRRCRGRDFGALLIGTGVSWLLSRWLGLRPEALTALTLTGWMTACSPIGGQMARMTYWMVPAPLKGRSSRRKFSLRSAYLLMAGAPVGFLSERLLGGLPSPVVYLLVVVGVIFYVAPGILKGRPLQAATSLLPLLLSTSVFLAILQFLAKVALGDDGGSVEFTGSVGEWIASDGGMETSIDSIAATAGAGLGPLAPPADPEELPTESQQINQITGVQVSVGPTTAA